MWRHELDMVSSLASESALAALVDMEKIISRDVGILDPLFHSGLTYSSDMLRVAGFVAPNVFSREIARTLSQLVLGGNEVDALRRALAALISYLKDALALGARPSLFFYEEALLLSNVSGHMPEACGSYFAPFVFWDVEEHPWRKLEEARLTLSRDTYQHALLMYLREKNAAELLQFVDSFEKIAEFSERACSFSLFRLLAAFFAAVTAQEMFLSPEEMQLFSMIDTYFFKQPVTVRHPDPVFISRLLHVVGKSTLESELVLETQAYFDLEGLLSGARLPMMQSIRA